MSLAGAQEVTQVRKVVVNGEPLHAGATGDVGDGGSGGTQFAMQLRSGSDDTVSRLLLTVGTRLQTVFTRIA